MPIVVHLLHHRHKYLRFGPFKMAAASASNQTYGGAIPPPPGVTPNFIDPHKVTGGVVPVSAVFLTLSTIALGLRLYTKIGVLKMFGKEDGK